MGLLAFNTSRKSLQDLFQVTTHTLFILPPHPHIFLTPTAWPRSPEGTPPALLFHELEDIFAEDFPNS
jgi:hypothetical protein